MKKMEIGEKKVIRVTRMPVYFSEATDKQVKEENTVYDFFVFIQQWANSGLLYSYEGIKKPVFEKNAAIRYMLRPLGCKAVTEKEARQIIASRFETKGVVETVDMDGTPEENNLKVPMTYIAKDLIFNREEPKNEEVSPLLNNIQKAVGTVAILGYTKEEPVDEKCYKAYCCRCGKEMEIKEGFPYSCCNCGSENVIFDTVLRKTIRDNYNTRSPIYTNMDTYKGSSKKILYVKGSDDGIRIYSFSYAVSCSDGVIKEEIPVKSKTVFEPDKEIGSYKISRGKETPQNALDSIDIKNFLTEKPLIIYEDADNLEEFIFKNAEAVKKTGFLEIIKQRPAENALFIIYMAVITNYPFIQVLVKDGHVNLFLSLYDKRLTSRYCMEYITSEMDRLKGLIDTESKRNISILRLPPYIEKFLANSHADESEYYTWRDIYELTNISEADFDRVVNSYQFSLLHKSKSSCAFGNIGNILKYGYSLEELINYIGDVFFGENNKDSKGNKIYHSYSAALNDFEEYLRVCECLGVQPDHCPCDLKNQHDSLIKRLEEQVRDRHDEKQKEFFDTSETMRTYFRCANLSDAPKKMKDFIVDFPLSQTDFIREGTKQNNCAALYYDKVAKGDFIVFFLRKADAPCQPYITASCDKRGKLLSYRLNNNREVINQDIAAVCYYVAEKIHEGIIRGVIRTF